MIMFPNNLNLEDEVSYELHRSITIIGLLLLLEKNRSESNHPSPTMVMAGDLLLTHTIKLLHRTTMMTAVIGVSPPLLPDLSTTVMVMVTVISTLPSRLDPNIDPLQGTMTRKISRMMAISLPLLAIQCMERT